MMDESISSFSLYSANGAFLFLVHGAKDNG